MYLMWSLKDSERAVFERTSYHLLSYILHKIFQGKKIVHRDWVKNMYLIESNFNQA